jgi:uncharacterized OsmC-like protein
MTSTVIYAGDLKTVATHLQSGTTIETDPPVDNQGKGESFSPTDLTATSLATCMATIMGIKAKDMNVNLIGMKISVLKTMKADPRRIGGIDVSFEWPANFQADEKTRLILERSANTCPVMYSLHPDIEVKVAFNWDKIAQPA